jgi:hypothetical protein
VDGSVILHGSGKTFNGKLLACFSGNSPCAEFRQDRLVVRRVADQRYTLVVFCRSADERHSADINILDHLGIGYIRPGDGSFEGIEIDGDQVDVVPAQVK